MNRLGKMAAVAIAIAAQLLIATSAHAKANKQQSARKPDAELP